MPEASDSKFSKMKSRWKIYVLSAAVGLFVMAVANGADRPTITTAAQNIISLAAFLAAASGVLTAIYLGQILKEIPLIVKKSVPSISTVIQRAVVGTIDKQVKKLGEAETVRQNDATYALTQEATNRAFKDWMDEVRGSMRPAKQIRNAGRNALYLLVTSALTAVLVILTSSSFMLGVAVALMVLATWAIFNSWSVAEHSMEVALVKSHFFEGITGDDVKTVYPDPKPKE
jgi:hypothetical protein